MGRKLEPRPHLKQWVQQFAGWPVRADDSHAAVKEEQLKFAIRCPQRLGEAQGTDPGTASLSGVSAQNDC